MDLRDYLAANHLTAKSFGDLVNVSEFAIGKYVRGERIPRPEIMKRIAEVTQGQVRANDFFPAEAEDQITEAV